MYDPKMSGHEVFAQPCENIRKISLASEINKTDEEGLIKTPVVPPLKWAGGKRWFAANHKSLIPKEFNKYIEPFVGSAALFFDMQPKEALLADLNQELINLYTVIRDKPKDLAKKMRQHQRNHNFDYYYKMRAMDCQTDLTKAARTLYLNRTCWNGLYRVNLKGEFNVPKGTKDKVVVDTDDFPLLASVLKNIDLKCQDFELSINSAKSGDFLFVDPPYTVAHNNNGFVKYNQNLFSWDDQIRLRNAVLKAARRGVHIVVTNANHQSVKDLYVDKAFSVQVVARASTISGASKSRGKFEEIVIQANIS